jgi:hypothetical protein
VNEILKAVIAIGGKLWLEKGQFCYELPKNLDDLLEQLREHKLEVIAWLEANHQEPETRDIKGLPWKLERLVSAASSGRLPSGTAQLGCQST